MEDLRDIARGNNIKGFHGLKKDELIELIFKNINYNAISLEDIFNNLPISQKYLLMILAKKRNGLFLSNKLKKEFIEKYSSSTYYSAIDNLSLFCLIFQIWDEIKEDDFLVIPFDFLANIRKIIKNKDFVLEKPEFKKKEIEKIKDLRDILKKVKKKELYWFCDDYNLAKLGTKKELIDRIMNAGFDVIDIINIPSKAILKWACEVLGCNVSGTKDDLKQQIIQKLHLKPKTPKKLHISKKLDELLMYLRLLRPPKPRKEDVFASYLFGNLEGKYGDYNVKREKTSKGGTQRFDIVLWNEVLIETKVTNSKKKVRDGLGQLLDYLGQNENYKYGILAVYDLSAGRNLLNQFPDVYYNIIYTIFW